MECFIFLIVWCIIAVLAIFIGRKLVECFTDLPEKIWQLIGLLVGLLVFISFLQCCGVVTGTPILPTVFHLRGMK